MPVLDVRQEWQEEAEEQLRARILEAVETEQAEHHEVDPRDLLSRKYLVQLPRRRDPQTVSGSPVSFAFWDLVHEGKLELTETNHVRVAARR